MFKFLVKELISRTTVNRILICSKKIIFKNICIGPEEMVKKFAEVWWKVVFPQETRVKLMTDEMGFVLSAKKITLKSSKNGEKFVK